MVLLARSWRDYDPSGGGEDGDSGVSYYLQAGYFVWDKLKVYSRLSMIDCKAWSLHNTSCQLSAGEDSFELSLGFSKHLVSHPQKIGAKISVIYHGGRESRKAGNDFGLNFYISSFL